MKIGPKFKIARRLGSRIFPKTQTTKFSISGSAQRGGIKGGAGRRPRAASEYGLQLIEKQKARYTYGLKESQFSSYVKKARAAREGSPTVRLYQGLETRLDNVVFRLGLVPSRAFARQLVGHGHVMVNGRRANVPSQALKVGDKVSIRSQSRQLGLFKTLAERLKNYQTPEWLLFNPDTQTGEVKGLPTQVALEANLDLGAVLEFYGRV